MFGQQVIASSGNIPSLGTPPAMMSSITQPIGIGLPLPPIPTPGLCAAQFKTSKKTQHNVFQLVQLMWGTMFLLFGTKISPGTKQVRLTAFMLLLYVLCIEKVTTPTFVPPTILPPPPMLPPPPPVVPTTPIETDVNKEDKEQSKSPRPASDGKATPELDSM